MADGKTHPIINLADITPEPFPPERQPPGDAVERFAPLLARIGPMIGARHLGCMLTVLPPGKRGFPLHSHRVNEEMFIILSGTGTLRLGAERHALRAGDIVACPPGGPEQAHQILNDGTEELRYLGISTMQSPDIVDYPDSGKVGITHLGTGFRLITTPGSAVDYWQDE